MSDTVKQLFTGKLNELILVLFVFWVFPSRAFSRTPATRDGDLFIEAESFSEKGGWSVDQQFMDIMGSPYLIAHGMGVPVQDASATVGISAPGVYHVWVRTYNWTAPWTSAEGPGAFRVKLNGKPLKTVLGTTGNRWSWQYAGSRKLAAGPCTLALSDLSGFDGRCDAIWLTQEEGSVPPAEKDALEPRAWSLR